MTKLELDYCLDKESKKEVSVEAYSDVLKGMLACPFCFWDLWFKKWRAENKDWTIRQSHFFHIKECANIKVDSIWESEKHKIWKEHIMSVFDDVFKWDKVDVVKKQKEFPFDEINRIADTYFQFTYVSKQNEVVIEIQYSDIPESELILRHTDYKKQGIKDIRVVGIAYDKKGKIANKTLSLLSKISAFQNNALLIDGDKLYIIRHQEVISLINDIKISDDNSFLITLFPEKLKIRKQIKAFAYPIWNKKIEKVEDDLELLNIHTIWKEFFIAGTPSIYNIEEEKNLAVNENIRQIEALKESITTDDIKNKLYELAFNSISYFEETITYLKDEWHSTYSKLNHIIYWKDNIWDKGLFSALLQTIEGIKRILERRHPAEWFNEFLQELEVRFSLFLQIYRYFSDKVNDCDKSEFIEYYKENDEGIKRFNEEYWVLYGLYFKCRQHMKKGSHKDIDNIIWFIYKALFEDKDIENKLEVFIEKLKVMKVAHPKVIY